MAGLCIAYSELWRECRLPREGSPVGNCVGSGAARRFKDTEDGVSVDVLQREVDEVGGGIDADGVGVGHLEGSDAGEGGSGEVEDGDGSGFRGDVEALEAGIEGEDVGVAADLVCAKHLHGGEVDDGEGVVGFAGDEGEMGGVVEGDAMGVCDAGQEQSMGDDCADGVDGGQLVEVVDGDEDVAGAGIIDGVAGAATEGNFFDEAVGGGVDDDVDVAVLIGDEDAVGARSVGDAIGRDDGADAGDDPEGAGIDDAKLMQASGGGVNAMQAWHDEDAVDAGESGQVGDDFASAHIEDDKMAGVHVRDVEHAGGGVEGLIVKADGGAGHGDGGDEGHSAAGSGARLGDGKAAGGGDDERGCEECDAELQHGGLILSVETILDGLWMRRIVREG